MQFAIHNYDECTITLHNISEFTVNAGNHLIPSRNNHKVSKIQLKNLRMRMFDHVFTIKHVIEIYVMFITKCSI